MPGRRAGENKKWRLHPKIHPCACAPGTVASPAVSKPFFPAILGEGTQQVPEQQGWPRIGVVRWCVHVDVHCPLSLFHVFDDASSALCMCVASLLTIVFAACSGVHVQ